MKEDTNFESIFRQFLKSIESKDVWNGPEDSLLSALKPHIYVPMVGSHVSLWYPADNRYFC